MSTLPTYEFGPYSLDAAERTLRRGREIVPLTLKAFETLLELVKNSGRVIEKEELLNAVWNDSFVEEATLAQNIFTLRKMLGKAGNGRSYIETVQRRGYRFVAPVRVVEKRAGAARKGSPNRNARAKAAAHAGPTEWKELNAVAVLVLDNACEDPLIDRLSEGIAERIINSLARLPSLRVISRSTILRYKGKGISPQEVGRELGVPTVLVGKVFRLDWQLHVSVELVDVQHGWQIWGEQYNREIFDVFKIQEDVAEQITDRVQSKLTRV
jgi:DNA-binding winged helix-turn-helix (wHTH) protein